MTSATWDALGQHAKQAMDEGRFAEAAGRYQQLCRLISTSPSLWNLLGIASHRAGQISQAIAAFRHAIALAPDVQDYRFHLAMSLLISGQFREGWRQFEHRPGGRFCQRRRREHPLWNGEPLTGKTLILAAEQGIGDTIHGIRFAQLVKERFGGTILLQAPRSLLPLLASCRHLDGFIGRDEPLPSFDCFVPLWSIPSLVDYDPAVEPVEIPYVFPQAGTLAEAARRMLAPGRRRVGIAWQGDPTYPADAFRSIPLRAFAPLAEVPDVSLISLQKGFGTEQIPAFQAVHALIVPQPTLDDANAAFMGTASFLKQLDLVVTSDSALAHLAGAIGVPCWVPLPPVPDWRWGLAGERSVWYPSLRLFRLNGGIEERPMAAGLDWAPVMQEIAAAMTQRTTGVSKASSILDG